MYYGIVKEKEHEYEISVNITVFYLLSTFIQEHIANTVAEKSKAKKKQSVPVQKPVVEAPELKDLSRELEDIQDKANPNTSIKGNLTLLFHFL